MPHIEPILDADGRPALLISGPLLEDRDKLDALHAKGVYQKGELFIIVPFDAIAQFALSELPKAIEAEIATSGTESAI